jgi:hypothetical protein
MSKHALLRKPGQLQYETAFALPLRDDRKTWSGKVTFTANKPIDVEVLHTYNPRQSMDEGHMEPYNAVLEKRLIANSKLRD